MNEYEKPATDEPNPAAPSSDVPKSGQASPALVAELVDERPGNSVSQGGVSRHGWTAWISWLAIIGMVLFQIATNQLDREAPADEDATVNIMDAQLQGKIAMFLESVAPAGGQPGAVSDQSPASMLRDVDSGSVQSRLAKAILLAHFKDLAGARRAVEELDRAMTSAAYQPTASQKRLIGITRALLQMPPGKSVETESKSESSKAMQDPPESADPETQNSETQNSEMPGSEVQGSAGQETREADAEVAGSDAGRLSPEDRQFLIKQLGWIGELGAALQGGETAAVTQDVVASSWKTVFGLVFLGMGLVFWGLIGLVAGALILYLLVAGRLRSRFESRRPYSVVYLETFAIWMVSFVAAQIGLAVLVRAFLGEAGQDRQVLLSWVMYLMPVAFLGSLVVLLWPLLRGVSPSDLRRDIGWYGNPLVEGFWGVVGQVSSFLLLAAGFIATIVIVNVLNAWRSPADELAGLETMGHPIQEVMSGDFKLVLVVFFATCVCAPLVEETFFRGVLYRYLRDIWQGGGIAWKVVFAVLTNSLIFAVIHPQGVAGVPVLTALAIMLSLIREYRGSLWGSVTVHAVHNFFVTLMAFLLMS